MGVEGAFVVQATFLSGIWAGRACPNFGPSEGTQVPARFDLCCQGLGV